MPSTLFQASLKAYVSLMGQGIALQEKVVNEANNWVFVDGKMVAASAIAETDLAQAAEIRMTRPLVGGQ